MHRDQPGQDASISTNRPPFHEKQPGRRGGSAGTIRGDRKRSAPVAAANCEPGDLPSVPGIMPILGRLPAASTEVVLAEGFDSALPLVVHVKGVGSVPPDGMRLAPVGGRYPARTFLSSLIPVLVTGIQPRRVRAVNESTPSLSESLVPKDLGTLDPCDKHRDEGSGWSRAFAPRAAVA
jgi:hypothetical protein